jgi:hypothetical protein
MEAEAVPKIRTFHLGTSVFSFDIIQPPMYAMVIVSAVDGGISFTGPLVSAIISRNTIESHEVRRFTAYKALLTLELESGQILVLGEISDTLSAYAWINRVNYLYSKRPPRR